MTLEFRRFQPPEGDGEKWVGIIYVIDGDTTIYATLPITPISYQGKLVVKIAEIVATLEEAFHLLNNLAKTGKGE